MSTSSDCMVSLAPVLEGGVTKVQLIQPECMFAVPFRCEGLAVGSLFNVMALGFTLDLRMESDRVVLRRNTFTVELPFASPVNRTGATLLAKWSPTEVSLLLEDKEGKRNDRATTPNTFPPHALVEWARREALLPLVSYQSPKLLYQNVLEQLQLLRDRI